MYRARLALSISAMCKCSCSVLLTAGATVRFWLSFMYVCTYMLFSKATVLLIYFLLNCFIVQDMASLTIVIFIKFPSSCFASKCCRYQLTCSHNLHVGVPVLSLL